MPTINLGRIGFVNKGGYSSGTTYKVNDVVTYNNKVYACIQATTGNAPTNTSYWVNWIGDTPAGGVTFTPTGGISSTDVQAAIAELDTEKATKATTLSGYGITDATPSSHIGSGGSAHAAATTTVDGFMSYTDKTKLDNISGATTTPNMDGTASVGTSTKYAREDHTHPSDTSKQSVNATLTSVAGLSTSTTGLMKLTNGTASLVTGSTGSGNIVYSADPTLTGTATAANLSYTGTLTGGTGVVNIGSGQIYKDASGNVGIGTSSPNNYAGYKTLSINGTSGGEIDFLDGGTTRGQIYSASTGMTFTSLGAIPLAFGINGTERMRITSSGNLLLNTTSDDGINKLQVSGSASISGNVGIGTSSPVNKLHIEGSAPRISILNTGQRHYSIGSTSTNFTIIDESVSTERMRIDSSGNVGIGTSSPAAKLDVVGNLLVDVFDSGGGIYFRRGYLTDQQPSIVVSDHNGGANDGLSIRAYDGIDFKINGSERMRIDSSGNVGIGTSSPSGRLHIEGDSSLVGVQAIFNDTRATVGKKYTLRSDGGTFVLRNGTSGIDNITVTSSGNLLVGTTTDNGVAKLQVSGSISADKPLAYSGITVLTGGVNLNNYKTGNVYYADASVLNTPSATEYFVEIIAYGGSWTIQRASNIRDARMYQRAFNASSGTWTAWAEK